MKYFLLLLILITFTKINIFSKIIDINIDGEEDVDPDGETLYIRTDLSSKSGGFLTFVIETEENENPKFNYQVVQSKDEDLEKIEYEDVEYKKTNPKLSIANFYVIYYFSDSDKYGILKITGLKGSDDITIKITYTSSGDSAIIIIIVIAACILLGIIICWVCKKFC